MIHLEKVTKAYGSVLANDEISLDVARGELAVLLGPNGAGKSTLLKSVCGLLNFDGVVTIDGHPNNTPEAKRLLGYVPDIPALYPMLTVQEHLEFIARAYRLPDARPYAEELLEHFELMDQRNRLGKELSKGMAQKLSACCAMLPKPQALILDEPLHGLDPHGIRMLKDTALKLRDQGAALLVSIHIIESVANDWNTCFILNKGKMVKKVVRTELNGTTLEQEFFSAIGQQNPEEQRTAINETAR